MYIILMIFGPPPKKKNIYKNFSGANFHFLQPLLHGQVFVMILHGQVFVFNGQRANKITKSTIDRIVEKLLRHRKEKAA